jgi:hypothetical protein
MPGVWRMTSTLGYKRVGEDRITTIEITIITDHITNTLTRIIIDNLNDIVPQHMELTVILWT